MSEDGTQKWIGRNRPPRVQITYDLETRGAIEKKELPLVVGIIADLSGTNPKPADVAALKLQKFIEIDRDNFDEVMKSIAPTLNLLGQDIVFETVDDFTPDRLVETVPALINKLKTRQQLSDLLVAVDRDEKLGAGLLDVAKNPSAAAPPAAPPATPPPATPPPAAT